MSKKPFISVVLPCRNEEKYIRNCLNSLVNQDYGSENYEIVMVDGLSEDKTIEIAKKTCENFPNLRIFTNEKRVTPFAMTKGAQNAKGDIIVLVIGHALYASDFLSSGVRLFEKYPDASCVGGPVNSIGENPFSKALAIAMSSYIGLGNVYHRMPGYEGEGEEALFPFFKREVFDALGYYDERFIRNQDDEFAFRVKLSGRKIYLSSTIKNTYIVRNSPKKLLKQYYSYGYYKWFGFLKHKKFISKRHFIPALFVFSVIVLSALAITTSHTLLFLSPILFYLFVLISFALMHIKKGIKIALYLVLAILVLHFSYGLGFLVSFLTVRKI